ncbi:hypothetical protein CN481_10560 [Bacillus sp. AFS006103]|nr:hypothetical protein CN481_10560 [Bacillus sp. AFS006103]
MSGSFRLMSGFHGLMGEYHGLMGEFNGLMGQFHSLMGEYIYRAILGFFLSADSSIRLTNSDFNNFLRKKEIKNQ